LYLSYDLWKSYVRDDEEKIYGSNCKDDYCKATDFARVTTLLALLLTVVAAGGLWRYQRSQDAEARAKRFERCCGLLAVGGFAGLVGASNYSVAMAAAVQDWDKDALDNDYTKTCAAGCALSLSFGLIATVAGAAAVFLQRKYARASETDAKSSFGGCRVKIKENFLTQSDQYCTVATLEVPAGHEARGARITGHWRDQGWGNRKGKVCLLLLQGDKEVAASCTDSCAPHSWAKLSLALDGFSATAGDVLAVQVRVGGGGGHGLKLNATAILDTAPLAEEEA